MKNSRIVGLSALLFSILLIVGCGDKAKSEDVDANSSEDEVENVQEDSSELGDYEIILGGDVQEEGDQFIVEGTSNLIPGSRLVGEVIVDEGETIFSDTTELVNEDGTFHMELEHHKYGEAEIIIRFDFQNVQDDEVKRHYGEKGQKLEGPFIYKTETFDGILKRAEAKITYDPDVANELTVTAPQWYDLPDDYGDPRVWIEIEDITDDGEFFYVHGKSNLLEGSDLRIKYKFNNDKTVVKPDGSFDFKFDYEYLEDEEMVILFEPNFNQWNEIKEAYGETGQKLVGNLVVADKHNNEKQTIEKRIPWDNESGSSKNDELDAAKESDETSSDAAESEEKSE